MKRKITALALASWCGGLGASELSEAPRARSRCNIEAMAKVPKPQKPSRMNSLRLRVKRTCSGMSVHVEESVEVKHREREFARRLLLDEIDRQPLLFLGW